MIAAIIKLVFSVAATVGGVYLLDEFSPLWVAPVSFVAGFLAANVLIWLFYIIIAGTANKNPKGDKLSLFYGLVMNAAIVEACKVSRVKVKVKGEEIIPKTPYLLVANHKSNFDNFILTSVIKNPRMIFISKPENFKIPFAGRLAARCRYLSIDKQNSRNALKTIHKAAEMIKEQGAYVGVFPEGKRVFEEGVLEPFSEGCFLVAKKAACPIVVASLKGSQNIRKNFPWTTEVELNFLKVITAEEVAAMRSGELSDIAYNAINESIHTN